MPSLKRKFLKRLAKELLDKKVPRSEMEHTIKQASILNDKAYQALFDAGFDKVDVSKRTPFGYADSLSMTISLNPKTTLNRKKEQEYLTKYRRWAKDTPNRRTGRILPDVPIFSHEVGHAVNLAENGGSGIVSEQNADIFSKMIADRLGIDVKFPVRMSPAQRQRYMKYLLGAGGIAVGSTAFTPDEAEAMNRKAAIKAMRKLGYTEAAEVAKTIPGRHLKELWGMHEIPADEALRQIELDRESFGTYGDKFAQSLRYIPSDSPQMRKIIDKMEYSRPGIFLKAGGPARTPIHEIGHGTAEMLPRQHVKWVKQRLTILEEKGILNSESLAASRAKGMTDEEIAHEVLADAYAGYQMKTMDEPFLKELVGPTGYKKMLPYFKGEKGRGTYYELNRPIPYDMGWKPLVEVPVKGGVGQISSAAKRLVGNKLRGKTIGNVTQGKGEWRTIHYTDGTSEVMHKKDVSEVARAIGHKEYTQKKFNEQDFSGKTDMALKRLDLNVKRAERNPFEDARINTSRTAQRLRKIKSIDEPLEPDEVMIKYQGKTFAMPTTYAEHLEQAGAVKIIKRFKE